MAGGKTAVLAINGAALPASVTIDIKTVLAPDGKVTLGSLLGRFYF